MDVPLDHIYPLMIGIYVGGFFGYAVGNLGELVEKDKKKLRKIILSSAAIGAVIGAAISLWLSFYPLPVRGAN